MNFYLLNKLELVNLDLVEFIYTSNSDDETFLIVFEMPEGKNYHKNFKFEENRDSEFFRLSKLLKTST